MKRYINIQTLIFLLIVASLTSIYSQQKFFVNLNNRDDKLFKVTLIPEKLSSENKIYQFASTAPGTYQIMDIGRFVLSFKAFDDKETELETKNISTNQWELEEPEKTSKIIYTVADTWDYPVKENQVFGMCGSLIEKDNVLINGQCVFGYFHGMQKEPLKIKLEYPNEWTVGTALRLDSAGFYDAPDYDYIVDSPILLGTLTKASTKVEKTAIDVYVYSKSGLVNAAQVETILEEMLSSTSQFTNGLPVDHYAFLFHFENFSVGAWEHNYCSEYILNETPLDDRAAKEVRSMAAHEFYHVITPLNIHSELIGNFNFEKPVMSQHLWLYEGVTEWAAHIIQLRDYLISLDDYLKTTADKIKSSEYFDQALSLVDLSLHSTERQDQYFNIYQKGAIVACLLDIRLLELSKGTKGLREVINQLYKDYGANKAFSENGFFDELVKRTYPEIADFINKYIKGTEKLPIAEYFAKLGIIYDEAAEVDSSKATPGFRLGIKNNEPIIVGVENPSEDGVKQSDIIKKLNGEEVNPSNLRLKADFIQRLKIGVPLKLTIVRNGEEKEITVITKSKTVDHQFDVMDKPSEQQLLLRNAWMKNL
jgi:predicted metalloprotease with PDZ domain